MKEIYRGVVKFYNNSRGFGFIDYDNSKSIFFHKSEMIDEVTESDFVNFKISTSNKTGKPVATNVTLIGDKINKSIETIEKKYNITEKIDPQNILKSISENWKLEAKLEKGKDYFFHSAELNQITDRNKCYIIGRKGTGKSSISEYILNLKSYNIFTEKLSFKNFPFNELYSFEYITRSTHLRPRDFIRYLQVCSEETVEKGRRYIGGETIKYVDRAFSNYLRDEIVDEVYPLVPEIEEILQIISNNRKWKFSYYEFKKHFEKYHRNKTIKESNYDYVLDILYRFSVLGNEHQSQKNILYFKYFHTNMNLNRSEQLVIHRGLFKALQII